MNSLILSPSQYNTICPLTGTTYKALAEKQDLARPPCGHLTSFRALYKLDSDERLCHECQKPVDPMYCHSMLLSVVGNKHKR